VKQKETLLGIKFKKPVLKNHNKIIKLYKTIKALKNYRKTSNLIKQNKNHKSSKNS